MSTTQKLIAGFLLLLILILTNMLASLLSWKVDLTDGKLFTLSAGSKALVQKLEEPIVLDYYFTRDVKGCPFGSRTTLPGSRKCCANLPAPPPV